jgi:predicted GIY-YIG superfamily endonuclease
MHTTTVYLVCFHPGLPRGQRPGNACHYLGSTSYRDPAERLREHLAGAGSPLVKAAYDRGLVPEIVATWPGSKQTERAMKRRHRLSHYCPRCNPA